MFKSHIKLMVLKLLSRQKMSGYDIMKSFENIGKKTSPGYIYPLLLELEKKNFISSQKEGRRKIYFLRKAGEKLLDELKTKREESVNTFIKILEPISEEKEITKFLQHREEIGKNKNLFEEKILLKKIAFKTFAKSNQSSKKNKETILKILKETLKKIENLK